LVQVFHIAGRNAVTDANVVGHGASFKVATQNGTCGAQKKPASPLALTDRGRIAPASRRSAGGAGVSTSAMGHCRDIQAKDPIDCREPLFAAAIAGAAAPIAHVENSSKRLKDCVRRKFFGLLRPAWSILNVLNPPVVHERHVYLLNQIVFAMYFQRFRLRVSCGPGTSRIY